MTQVNYEIWTILVCFPGTERGRLVLSRTSLVAAGSGWAEAHCTRISLTLDGELHPRAASPDALAGLLG